MSTENSFLIFLTELIFRWGRASYGGFNKNVEKLATRMNSALPDDNELDEEEDLYGVAERLRSIREGKRGAHLFHFFLLIFKFRNLDSEAKCQPNKKEHTR